MDKHEARRLLREAKELERRMEQSSRMVDEHLGNTQARNGCATTIALIIISASSLVALALSWF